jgi:hypothetical protein
MKPTLPLSILTLLFATPALAMMSIEEVSPARAKELGVEVKTVAAGPEAARIEVSFEPKGELKSFLRVDLEMHEAGKLLIASTLQEEKSKPGKVTVGFAVDRASVDKVLVRIVSGRERDMSGHDLHLKDFIDVKKLGAAVPADEEARFLAVVRKAFDTRDPAGLNDATCWDGMSDQRKQNLRHVYKTLVEDPNVAFDFSLVDPERDFIDRDIIEDGIAYRPNLPLTRQLNAKGRRPSDKQILMMLCFGVGEKDGKLFLMGSTPKK